MICDRCGKESNTWTMSMFNLDELCMACKDLEREHPLYETARNTEIQMCVAGEYNFPGIGLPDDYEEWVNEQR